MGACPQPSMVRGDLAVVPGPSQAEAGQPTQLTKDGAVGSMLRGGAVLQGGFARLSSVSSIYVAPARCARAGLMSARSQYEGLLPSCGTISSCRRNGKSNKNTRDKQMQ